MIAAGALRVRVTVQKPVTSRGSTGEELVTWTTVVERPAGMWQLNASEPNLAAMQITGVGRYQFRLRYESLLSDISPKWRLVIADRIFDIEGINNVMNRNRELLITAIELI